ncbi:MAG: hypothetical protein GF317_09970 [Candidatus Lokiarchaeota archaeon]|nr:hypothetical protein [Candidatus Lokiarchaeota archaeon]MBD3200002.1 hypothetical protein [Candidatus Lokiarchaeota archaeon]
MLFQDYFDALSEGIEFLIAFGSIMGLLGLIVGILGFLILPNFKRYKLGIVIIASLILLGICGFETGLRYFHIL